jgi:hypothetical protein
MKLEELGTKNNHDRYGHCRRCGGEMGRGEKRGVVQVRIVAREGVKSDGDYTQTAIASRTRVLCEECCVSLGQTLLDAFEEKV